MTSLKSEPVLSPKKLRLFG